MAGLAIDIDIVQERNPCQQEAPGKMSCPAMQYTGEARRQGMMSANHQGVVVSASLDTASSIFQLTWTTLVRSCGEQQIEYVELRSTKAFYLLTCWCEVVGGCCWVAFQGPSRV